MSRSPVDDPIIGLSETAALWCVRLADGWLTPAQQAEFDAWLAEDAAHAEAFEEAASTWREFAGAESAPEFLRLRMDALRQSGARRRFAFLSPRWAVAAAAVLLVASAGLWIWVSAPTVYRTGVAERRVAVLKDGSKISLDAATIVRVRYSANRRDLELIRGRAKFDVAKDPMRPFSVVAGQKVVVATGTEFSIELLQRKVHVILYEGHVAVLDGKRGGEAGRPLRLGSSNAPADQGLAPGRELVVAETSDEASVAPTDLSRDLSWEAGQLVFVDEPLSSAVERVNRYSKEKLEIGDAAAGQVRVTGVFTAGDVQAFLEGVSAAFPVRAIQRGAHRQFVLASSAS
ncbi:MAG TPA: FecR domain-containing protein [Phenylobacterium sp.]|jgi:transmembrane sensor|uniref:FecR family protein n=1 Tax=Phenylobacterium sp. TaxID=1871053 RepID=UPI002BFAFD3C|nr:FecR domain-containing protein [Phenylobacterium sp.]HXA37370.1 FecR domain-containing protein [Phenylobacterium sp.]